MSSSKERILTRIRTALVRKDPMPFPGEDLEGNVYSKSEESGAVLFVERFQAVGGNFIYSESAKEAVDILKALVAEKKWRNLHCWDPELQDVFAHTDFRECRIGTILDKADAGITRCEALIARTGSILLSSKLSGGRTLPIFPPVQIVFAEAEQVVNDIDEGIAMIRRKYRGEMPSMINLATGPSRTADIEKTLVLGAHGPGEVYVFLIDG